MTETLSWLERYGKHHENMTWPWVYWASVPMFIVGAVGLLWSLPVPDEFQAISPLLNWGSAFLMATAVYYFIISLALAIGLLPFLLGVAYIQIWFIESGYDALRVAFGLVLAATIGLWLGHRSREWLPAMLEDFQTIMLGPAWLLSIVYRRLGIPL